MRHHAGRRNQTRTGQEPVSDARRGPAKGMVHDGCFRGVISRESSANRGEAGGTLEAGGIRLSSGCGHRRDAAAV